MYAYLVPNGFVFVPEFEGQCENDGDSTDREEFTDRARRCNLQRPDSSISRFVVLHVEARDRVREELSFRNEHVRDVLLDGGCDFFEQHFALLCVVREHELGNGVIPQSSMQGRARVTEETENPSKTRGRARDHGSERSEMGFDEGIWSDSTVFGGLGEL